jgi:hypothetical protein
MYIIQVNFRVYGGGMAQAVSRQPLTAESRVLSGQAMWSL